MNLDELKSAWNTEKADDVHIPRRLEQLRKANHPLDKLKRNMKKEWYMQLLALVFLGFAPVASDVHTSTYIIYYAAYGMSLIVSIYYLTVFRQFYLQINHYTADTKDSLTEIYYQFRLNMERYHSFGFLLIPLVLVWGGVYTYSKLRAKGLDFSSLSESSQYILIGSAIVVTGVMVAAMPLWTRFFYGKYTRQLKQVLDELKDGE